MKRSVIGVFLLAVLAACSGASDEPDDAAPATSEVRYEVFGEARTASITVRTTTGTSQQDIDIPLTNKGGSPGLLIKLPRGSQAYISAQIQDRYGVGPIACSITINGTEVSNNESSGKFAITTCQATVR